MGRSSPSGTASPTAARPACDEHVYTSNPNGTNRRELAVGEYPVWSPNGKLIAFDSALDGDWRIYVMNANGTNVRRVDTGRFAGYYPSFQSNSRLSFDAGGTNVSANADYTSEGIWVVNLNGSGLAPLKTIARDDTDGAWSPDGKTLAFTTYVHGKGEIAVTTLDGKVKKLTHNTVDDFDPVWTPDGTHILFTSGRSGYDEVYVDEPGRDRPAAPDALPRLVCRGGRLAALIRRRRVP